MAKDGSNRGGLPKIGAGRKKKSLDEKKLEGKASEIIKSEGFTSQKLSAEMPPLKDFMTAKQKNGEKLQTGEIYSELWNWLAERGCENLIDNQLLEQYAMCVARWRQCEAAISTLGLKGRHPTTGGEMSSVYVKMSQDYLKLIAQLQYQIYSAVKENSSFNNLSQDSNDNMEMLLRMNRES